MSTGEHRQTPAEPFAYADPAVRNPAAARVNAGPARMLGCVGVALVGAVLAAGGLIGDAVRGRSGDGGDDIYYFVAGVGEVIVAVGLLGFAIDYVASWVRPRR